MTEPEASSSTESNEENITMLDVLADQKEYDADANAVLGASDAVHCTYDKGYLSRQALYACSTCVTADMDPAGICLACSLECHDGHELVELYTKRFFRCDCGNDKFPKMKCKLYRRRDSVNEKNTYNQNFKGTYCTCARPYPDPDDSIEDDMIQCTVCEDWFHGRHTACEVPDTYDEFTCEACLKTHEFLYAYAALFPKQTETEITKVNGSSENSTVDVEIEVKPTTSQGDASVKPSSPKKSPKKSPQKSVNKRNKAGDEECILKKLELNECHKTGGRFWPDSWRSKLCRCDDCMDMYETRKISYLLNEDDTILAYEKKGKENGKDSYQKAMDALQGIDRTHQVEMLSEFATMKDHLKDYLKKFADSGKVVREEDIKEFFAGLKSKKRQRTSLQYFCK